MRVIIVGCGDVGTRVGQHLVNNGHQVTGVRRNASVLPGSFTPLSADVTEVESLRPIAQTSADILIYALAANDFSDAGYEAAYVQGVHNTLTALGNRQHELKRIIFVSSTSVYHQRDHQWVDEASDTRPTRFSGQRILQGENAVLATQIGTVVRFSGIYGPDRRRLINKVKSGTISARTPLRFTNRIHIEDCAGVLAWLSERVLADHSVPSHYLASDSEPVTAYQVEEYIARRLGVKPVQQSSPTSRNPGSKRCRNTRLLNEGYVFAFPSYQHGYGAMMNTEAL